MYRPVGSYASTMGYDQEHDYKPPRATNIVDASKAVWKAKKHVSFIKSLIKCGQ